MCWRASLLYALRLKAPVSSRLMQETNQIREMQCAQTCRRKLSSMIGCERNWQQRAASAAPLDGAAVVCVLIHVGVAQASTRLQPSIMVMK